MTIADTVFPTGIPGLDTVLGGGITRPSLAIIIGSPGAGKTILASQILFSATRQRLKTIIFTAFSEGMTSYIQHMRSLTFFDEAAIGDTVQIFTLASIITEKDPSLVSAIVQTIRMTDARIVVLDGFQGLSALGMNAPQVQELLSSLASQIRYLDVTIIVTLAGKVRDPQFNGEITAADIVIGLHYTIQGRRHQRLLEIVKVRGRAQWAGLHSYNIDSNGMQVFPRIESYIMPTSHPNTEHRAPFHLSELDQLMAGGPNVGTTTILAGELGVGKTMLALYWALAEARPDATTLFLTFTEHSTQLQQKAATLGLDLAGAISQKSIRIVRLSSVDLNPDYITQVLLAELSTGHVRRLVLDDLKVLLHELGDRMRDYFGALYEIVYSANITSLYLLEIAPVERLQSNMISTPLPILSDNVIMMQQYEITGNLHRLLAVVRMRLSHFDRTICELILDEKGIRIAVMNLGKKELFESVGEGSDGTTAKTTQ